MALGVHLNLDDAWGAGVLGLPELDLRDWGPRLRYCAPPADVEAFYRHVEDRLAPFVLYGSGDFHYLTALLLRRVARPVTLVSFDNHPRLGPAATPLELWRLDPSRTGERQGRAHQCLGVRELRVEVPLAPVRRSLGVAQRTLEGERMGRAARRGTQRRFGAFPGRIGASAFIRSAPDWQARPCSVTVDLDCLRAAEAVSDWENGLFTVADLVWALARLVERSHVIGGDVCGAYSPSRHARWMQRMEPDWWDHPRLPPREAGRAHDQPESTGRALAGAHCRGVRPGLTTPGGSWCPRSLGVWAIPLPIDCGQAYVAGSGDPQAVGPLADDLRDQRRDHRDPGDHRGDDHAGLRLPLPGARRPPGTPRAIQPVPPRRRTCSAAWGRALTSSWSEYGRSSPTC